MSKAPHSVAPAGHAQWLAQWFSVAQRLSWQGRLNVLIALVVGMVVLAWLPLDGAMQFELALGVLALVWLAGLKQLLKRQLQAIRAAAEKTTSGDLTAAVAIDGQDELAEIGMSLTQMAQRLSAMVANVRSNTALVAHAGEQLASGNHELSQRTEQQAASLEETAASVQELNAAVQQTAQTAAEVNQLTHEVRGKAEQGHVAMESAVESMAGIQEGSRKVQDIVGVIDGIAFQTNILALNAAVEAARAGDQGRGFAVVASEVRVLAKRSSDAAHEIRGLIAHSAERVAMGEERVHATSKLLQEVLAGVREVAGKIESISTASSEQSTNLGQLSQAIDHLDGITQQNARMVDVAASTSSALQDQAQVLSQAVGNFRLRQATADEAMALVARAQAHIRQRTQSQAMQELTDPAGGFMDRDMYIFVLDPQGVYHAFGGQPAKVGTRVQDVAGVDGADIIHRFNESMKQGGGWVEYDYRNPTTGKVQPKMSYVVPCGDLILGAGVYKDFVG